MSGFIVFVVAVAVIITVIRCGIAYADGSLDGEYPSVARGDFRNGIARSAYLLGRRNGERRVTRQDERRKLTEDRRKGLA